MKVSVVVPTYRRPQLLNRCLAALAGQQFDHGKFEIIIVDDGPSADTGHLVLSWATHTLEHGPVIRYLANTGSHGPAAARNVVWPAACGDIIAFTDDDTVPAPGWRAYGVKAMRNGVVAAWGRLVMPIPDPPTDYELDAAGLERAEFVTANCFARKSAVEAIGGFDERFKLAWREDADLFFRLLKYDPSIEHTPHAVVVHPVRPAPGGSPSCSSARCCSTHCSTKSTPICTAERSAPYRLGNITASSPRSSLA